MSTPPVRRVVCRCGCGRWAYVPRRPGRPVEFLTPECYRRVRNVGRRNRYACQKGKD